MIVTEIQRMKQRSPSYSKDTLHHSVGGPLPVGDVVFKTPLSDAFLNAGHHCHRHCHPRSSCLSCFVMFHHVHHVDHVDHVQC